MGKQIAVLGSSNHRGANCYEWHAQFPNLSDNDIIIVNMRSLDDVTLNTIAPKQNLGPYLKKMESCRREIAQRLSAHGSLIIIYEPKRHVGGHSGGVSNMDWMPVELEIHPVSMGRKLELAETAKEGFLKRYLEAIVEYQFEIGELRINDNSEIRRFFGKQPTPERTPLLRTGSLASVAELIALKRDNDPRGSIIALHPPKEGQVARGIDLLIEDLEHLSEERPNSHQPPSDLSEIEMSGERELLDRLETVDEQMTTLSQQRKELKGQLGQLTAYKDLLWEWDDALDMRVREVFKLIGFMPSTIEGRGNKEDFVASLEGADVTTVVEVTGVEDQIDVRKARQLIDWVLRLSGSSKVKGVLVGNHCRKNAAKKRSDAFTEDAIKAAKGLNLCLIPAEDLFKVVCGLLQGQTTKQEIVAQILSTNGVWNPRVAVRT